MPEMTRRVAIRFATAALSGGLGTATLIELARIPAGVARGKPIALLRELLLGSGFWTSLVLCTLVAALALTLAVRLLARRYRLSHLQALRILEPLAWGAGLPVAALLLDPWWFWNTAPPLAVAGIGMGLISSHLRFRDETRDLSSPGLDDRAYILGFVALAILLPTLMVAPGPPWWPSISGDEPHYLIGARSLWVDHDVNVANEYMEKLHWGFYPADLSRHAKIGVAPDTLYSIHGVGLSLWLAPWFGFGQAFSQSAFTLLVRFSMTLWLGAFAAVLFLLLRDIAGSRSAVRGTLLAILTAPLLFASPHLFPEVPALTLSAAAYLILRRSPGVVGAFLAGLILAFLPWLHFKFFALTVAVAASGIWFLLHDSDNGREPRRSRYLAIVALAAPLLMTGIGHVLFTWQLYGRVSPLAVGVGTGVEARVTAFGDDYLAYVLHPWGTLRTGIEHILDQKEGLLFYAPHYLLAITGLAWLWQRRRADAVTLVLCLVSVWGPHALAQELGHWAPPARPLTSVVWTLALPMGIGATLAAGAGWTGKARSALRGVLIAWGIGMTVLLLPQSELLYHDHNISRSLVLLRYGAPGLSLWRLAPLWVHSQWVVSFLWLAAIAVTGVMLWRWGAASAQTAQSEPGTDGDSGAAGSAPGHTAMKVFVMVAAAVFLLHHLLVPVTGLHIRHDNGPVGVWVPEIPQGRAWHSSGGTWVGGDDSVEMLLSSREPLNMITTEIQAISAMNIEVQIGRDRQEVGLDAGEKTFLRHIPGPGRAWRGKHFYHFRVVAPGGTSHAALGVNRGGPRVLGVLVRVLEAR